MRLPLLAKPVLILWLLALAACSRPGTPETGEALLNGWVAALNSGDATTVQGYIERHQLNASVENMLAWQDETGGVEIVKLTEREPGRVTAILQTGFSDQLETVTLEFDDQQPAQITGFTYLLAERTPDLAIARTDEAGALAAAAAHADKLAAMDHYSGALLIARDGQVLLERYWGMADREQGIPVDADTRFRHGSMDKLFTAIAALRMVERGEMKLDNTLGELRPDYPQEDLHPATLRDLLAHRAGAGDIFGPEFTQNRLELKGTADYLRLFGEREPEFSPGSEFRYANYGYLLVAAMLEKASGQDYYALVRREVLEPAGMARTGAEPESSPVDGRAPGYQRKNRAWIPNSDLLPYRGMAAGGGYSTARDLLALGEALRSGRLLKPETLAEASTASTKDGWYGLGMMVSRGDGPRWYGHDGGAAGMSAYLRVYPDSGYIVVALSNLDPPRANWVGDVFANRGPVEAPSAARGTTP
jgi:CubicO group peptidase (beta-lactamase class C family)